MSDATRNFVPTELVGEHYRPIGGHYDSLQGAIDALGQHFNNRHGGGGSFHVYHADDTKDSAAIVEAASFDGDSLAIRALYKVIERRP